jgi:hypothetical protein
MLPVPERKNLFYVNQGIDKRKGVPVFKEQAERIWIGRYIQYTYVCCF